MLWSVRRNQDSVCPHRLGGDSASVCTSRAKVRDGHGQCARTHPSNEPPHIPSNAANLTPWTKSNFLAVRISAIASDQSQPLPDRSIFETRIAELSAIYGDDDDIPRPDNWGGFILQPSEIEFWQDQAFRMHDRLRFWRVDSSWQSARLYT